MTRFLSAYLSAFILACAALVGFILGVIVTTNMAVTMLAAAQ